MHAVALAITEHLTIRAFPFFSPLAVAIRFKLIIPYIYELILVDIPLVEVGPDTGTARDRSVRQDRGRIDAGVALEDRVSHLCLIIPEEALTAVANVYLTLFPAEADEVHDPCELFVRQLQIRLSRSTSNWEDRKDTPPFYAHLDQEILEEHQILEVALVYASHHIPNDLLFLGQHTDGIQCLLETFRITAKPVMRFLETI